MAWRGSIKIRAKNLLLGNSGKAAAMLAIPLLFALLLSGVAYALAYGMRLDSIYTPIHAVADGVLFPIVMLLLACLALIGSILVLAPLYLGREAWFWQRSSREFVTVGYLFRWYPKLSRAAGLWVRRKLLLLGWGLFFLLPGGVMLAVAFLLLARGSSVAVLILLFAGGAVLIAVGLVFWALMMQRYFLAPYLLADNQNISASAALRESALLMDGMAGRTLRFKLSFWPWFLLCVLVFPIYYVWPYYKQACACYGRYLFTSRKSPMRGKKQKPGKQA